MEQGRFHPCMRTPFLGRGNVAGGEAAPSQNERSELPRGIERAGGEAAPSQNERSELPGVIEKAGRLGGRT